MTLSPAVLEQIREYTARLARALQVVGLMNVQFAVQRDRVYVLEVNPRASRTVPFVSKATGVPLAKVAARVMVGRRLRDMNLPVVSFDGISEVAIRDYVSVKSPVFPFNKFRGVDILLGPEMRSTGEVMGIAPGFAQAFAKAQAAAGAALPVSGTVFISVNDRDKAGIVPVATQLARAGLHLLATRGTAAALRSAGLPVETVFKVNEGRPNVIDWMKTGRVQLIINTPLGRESFYDEVSIRRTALRYNIPCITTLAAAYAAARAIGSLRQQAFSVAPLQELLGERLAVRTQPQGEPRGRE